MGPRPEFCVNISSYDEATCLKHVKPGSIVCFEPNMVDDAEHCGVFVVGTPDDEEIEDAYPCTSLVNGACWWEFGHSVVFVLVGAGGIEIGVEE